jgi:hypothetical protein
MSLRLIIPDVRKLCTPVVLVDIFHFSEIFEQAPSLSHPVMDESRFYNLPIGSTAHPPWVRVGLSRKIPLCFCWDASPVLPASKSAMLTIFTPVLLERGVPHSPHVPNFSTLLYHAPPTTVRWCCLPVLLLHYCITELV